jgi:hypothetical protein
MVPKTRLLNLLLIQVFLHSYAEGWRDNEQQKDVQPARKAAEKGRPRDVTFLG